MSGVKAIVTGLSCLDDDRIVVFAQAIITNLQEARHSLDVNAFYVDTGAAAFKKKSKKDHRWLKEEVEKARITPGAVITVNGKQRYVRTEPEVVDLAKLLTAQSYFLFCPPFGFASNSSTRPRPHSAYPTGFIDQARRLCSDDQPDPNLTWVACKNVTVCYNQTARRREATLVAVSVVKMEQSGREVATSVQQTITAQLKCKMFQTKVGPQNPGPINLSSALALVNMVYVDVPPPQPRSYAVIESLLVY